MPNLSIKNVPDDMSSQLRARARDHHRSLQGELMAILEEAIVTGPVTIERVHHAVSSLGVSTGDDSTSMLREDRDAR
ncbi:MAG TPA: Arc family DNA-binding protein [Dehalococcoidia bacterium]|nr:Arc family DNA-binding protein [Dehalococcoidia bacterium]